MKFLSFIGYTLKETISQKIMIMLLVVLTIIIGLFILVIHIDAVNGNINSVSIYDSKPITAEELPLILSTMREIYVMFIFLATVVLCIITTAHIIPESMTNGTLDLFLSRPLSRASFIIGKFIGVIAAVASIQMYFTLGLWIVLNLKVNSWNWMFPLTIIPLILSFISIYSLMLFIGVLSKSTGVVIAGSLGHVIFLSNLLAKQGNGNGLFFDNSLFKFVRKTLYYLLPQYSDLFKFTNNLLAGQQLQIALLSYPILASLVFLIFSILYFRRIDF
ncbi:MAG: ABC transporter permease subunit [Bacteroidota bacterium]|nr:ABC transporter permease subunit [Bacteroidota bacterium]